MTRINPMDLAADIRAQYRRYLATTFPLVEPLHTQFLRDLATPGFLVKGPILEATAPFEAGKSMAELVAEGIAAKGFLDMHDPDHFDIHRPLYWHQEQAFRQVAERDRNAVISTGTGSGKTESFLLPIFDHLLRERDAGTLHEPGVRALLVYPMNALAHDQLKRLRTLLAGAPDITFGRYTGDTPDTFAAAQKDFASLFPGQPMLPNELLSRQQMQERPPHLLLTNYAMLEYLLLRPDDHAFFDGDTARHWRFWVLDEVHTYDGAVACDVAMLLRRVRDRVVASEPGRIRCIGTSATLGDPKRDLPQVAEFASNLFSEAFTADDVVVAKRESLQAADDASWGEGGQGLYAALRQAWTDEADVATMADIAAEHGVPQAAIDEARVAAGSVAEPAAKADEPSDDDHDVWAMAPKVATPTGQGQQDRRACQRFLWALLRGDAHTRQLRHSLSAGPINVETLSQRLFEAAADPGATLMDLVDLGAAARHEPEALPLLPARYHLFVRALEGAFLTFRLHPDGKLEPLLSLARQERREVDGVEQRVFELSTCRRCGHPYIAGQLHRDNDGRLELRQIPVGSDMDDANRGEEALFRWDEATIGEADEDDQVTYGTATNPIRHEPNLVCLCCGRVRQGGSVTGSLECDCGQQRIIQLQRVKTGSKKVSRCPTCLYAPPNQRPIDRITVGQDAPVAVLATTLYQALPPARDAEALELPGEGRKLMVFSDSRQDAAFFAPYLQHSYEDMLDRRRVMLALLGSPAPMPVPMDSLISEMTGNASLPLFPVQLHANFVGRQTAAWKWVMREFRAVTSRLSLEGLGLVRFTPILTVKDRIPEGPAKDRLGLIGQQACDDLMTVLLNSLRRNGAVDLPASLGFDDPVFEPLNRPVYAMKQGAVRDARLSIIAWTPKQTNARLDFLVRLLQRLQPELPLADAKAKARKFLDEVWERILTNGLASQNDRLMVQRDMGGKHGSAFMLNHTRWQIEPMLDAAGNLRCSLWKCPECLAFSSVNVHDVCPTYRCRGTLEPVTELPVADHHYRFLYQEGLRPIPMRAEEHTAQLANKTASSTQQQFIQGQVNVLSCSTTFELGVDVGDLQVVLMRNVPPATANYLQRAGRAGRRSDSVALALTYAQRRSHDLTHFRDPERMVGGTMPVPSATVRNVKLIRRHVNAIALAALFRQKPMLIGNIEAFFFTGDGDNSGPDLLKAYLDNQPADLIAALRRVVPADLHQEPELDIENWGWVRGLLDQNEGDLSLADQLVRTDIDMFEGLAANYRLDKQDGTAGYYERHAKTIKARNLLNFLGGHKILPKYGFPVTTVDLDILANVPAAARLELSRDLRMAITDYAPGSQVVAGGFLWTSAGLKRLPRKEWPRKRYVACCCGWFSILLETDTPTDSCGRCGNAKVVTGTWIEPEFGFVTSQEPPDEVGASRPVRAWSSRVYYSDLRSIDDAPEERPVGIVAPDGVGLHLASPREGLLVAINQGPHRAGFNICMSCGLAMPGGQTVSAQAHESPAGRACKGFWQYKQHLGHEFRTDVLELGFTVPAGLMPTEPSVFWRSLTYALIEGACTALQIRRDDLDGCLYIRADRTSIILYDNVPGGAGHVRTVEKHIEQVLRAALAKVVDCSCSPEASCYECLRHYRNQPYHHLLQRGVARDYLEMLVAACLEHQGDGAYPISISSRGRWLSRELQSARAATVIVPFVSLDSGDRQSPFVPVWTDLIKDLQRGGRSITLVISEDRLPNRSDANGAYLLHELEGLLMQPNFNLHVYAPGTPLPEWAIGVERHDGGGRLVRWASEQAAQEEGLSPATGMAGFWTTVREDAVMAGIGTMHQFVEAHTRRIKPDDPLFAGPQPEFRRIEAGKLTTVAAELAPFFEGDVSKVVIRDPYLRRHWQVRNLRAVLHLLSSARRKPAPSIDVITMLDGEPEYAERQERSHRDVMRDFPGVTFHYAAFHDRELHISKADGTQVTVLLGRGLDILDRDGYTFETYLASFTTKAVATVG